VEPVRQPASSTFNAFAEHRASRSSWGSASACETVNLSDPTGMATTERGCYAGALAGYFIANPLVGCVTTVVAFEVTEFLEEELF
jgi:hypothetical protein